MRRIAVRPDGARGMTLLEVLFAMIVVGVGSVLFFKMQKTSSGQARSNSQIMKAGQLIEKQVEFVRITVSGDTVKNWPPRDTTVTENGIKLVRTLSSTQSPKDGAPLPGVRRLDITASWGDGKQDTLKVSTYVSKKF
jgi:prepilin-type N-terminal cleavage/methylation domain-containing protein